MAVVGTLSKHMWSVESAGGRVRLRSASSAEVERFRSQADDPELDRLVLGGVGGVGRPESTSLVHDESDGSPIGVSFLSRVDWIHRRCSAAVWIAPGARGLGLGRAAVVATLDGAFARLNLHKVTFETFAADGPARSLGRDLGLRQEGRLVQELFVDGDYRDVILLAVTADEWAGPRAGETSSRRSGESGAVDLFSRTSVADSD